MALDSKHPLYNLFVDDWCQLRDCYAGERQVKEKAFTYLPPTSSMVEDGIYGTSIVPNVPGSPASPARIVVTGSKGWLNYEAYRKRARFPDWVSNAVTALVGVMHRKPAVIEVPKLLEPLIERATVGKESLQMVLRTINEKQVLLGRVGVLGDIVGSGERAGMPYLSLYDPETIINWDEGSATDELDAQSLNLVVLDESENEREDFEWSWVRKFRVLTLGPAATNENENGPSTFRVGVFRESVTFNEEALIEPNAKGRAATEIPFVFINAADITPKPSKCPMIGLSNLALHHYRSQADYRQALFMQGQDTLVVAGGTQVGGGTDDAIRVGAGARIDLQIGGDAKYVGVNSSGLPEMRAAIEADEQNAQQLAGQLLAPSGQAESGDALRIRVAARTATLVQIAVTGAFGLQESLRQLARWVGADPKLVKVLPSLDFVDDDITGDEVAKLMGAKTMGAPLSLETIHALLKRRGLTDKTFEIELAEIAEEAPATGSTNPNGPANDPNADPNADPKTDPKTDPNADPRAKNAAPKA